MASASIAAPNLSDERLVEMLSLIGDADSVELKLTVPEAAQRSAIAALDLDPLEAQIRQVFFFDTPDLALSRQGIVTRARRVQRKGSDSVVKLRPVVPDHLPDDLRRSSSFVVETSGWPASIAYSTASASSGSSVAVHAAAQRSVSGRGAHARSASTAEANASQSSTWERSSSACSEPATGAALSAVAASARTAWRYSPA